MNAAKKPGNEQALTPTEHVVMVIVANADAEEPGCPAHFAAEHERQAVEDLALRGLLVIVERREPEQGVKETLARLPEGT